MKLHEKTVFARLGVVILAAVFALLFTACPPEAEGGGGGVPGRPELPVFIQGTQWIHVKGHVLSFLKDSVEITAKEGLKKTYPLAADPVRHKDGEDEFMILYFNEDYKDGDYIWDGDYIRIVESTHDNMLRGSLVYTVSIGGFNADSEWLRYDDTDNIPQELAGTSWRHVGPGLDNLFTENSGSGDIVRFGGNSIEYVPSGGTPYSMAVVGHNFDSIELRAKTFALSSSGVYRYFGIKIHEGNQLWYFADSAYTTRSNLVDYRFGWEKIE